MSSEPPGKISRIAALFVLISLIAPGQSPPPRFEDYPALGSYKGRNAPVVLTRDDLNFKTRLRYASKLKPDFAGHYILAAWGCGGGCLMGAIIDANSGRVHWMPHTICCWPEIDEQFRPIAYRLNSRLIIFSGIRNEKNGDQGTHYYEFKDGKFIHILSVMRH